jgi:hypothetical protein
MIIEDEIYGIIPRENKDAFSNAPPTNVLNNPKRVFFMSEKAPVRASPLTPGMGICAPTLTTISTPMVKRIRCLNSGIVKIFLILSIIKLYKYLQLFLLLF